MICKGAPEFVVQVCSKIKKNASIVDLDKDYVERLLNELYNKGYRVVAIAEKPIEKKESYGKEDEKDLTLIGFLCFTDPVKPGIKKVVEEFKKYGVELKVLTGDNEKVAAKVMNDIGIEIKGVLRCFEIDSMDDEKLREVVEKKSFHKLKA